MILGKQNRGCKGQSPHQKGRPGELSPQVGRFLCLYSWLSRHFSPFYSPHPKPQFPTGPPPPPPSFLGGGGVYLTYLMILKHTLSVFFSIFTYLSHRNCCGPIRNDYQKKWEEAYLNSIPSKSSRATKRLASTVGSVLNSYLEDSRSNPCQGS